MHFVLVCGTASKMMAMKKLHCFQMSVKIYFATRIMLQDFAAKILLTFLMNCDQCIYQAWACF